MSVYALTPLAKADIFDIWSYMTDDTGLFSDPALAAEVKLQRGRILFAQLASLE